MHSIKRLLCNSLLGMLGPLFALVCTGCAEEKTGPKTYPVTGKVTAHDGNSVPSGLVQFQCVGDSTLTTFGEIQPDGTFTLHTLVGDQRRLGAIEGKHRVTLILSSNQPYARSVRLQQQFQVKTSGENHLVIHLPPLR